MRKYFVMYRLTWKVDEPVYQQGSNPFEFSIKLLNPLSISIYL